MLTCIIFDNSTNRIADNAGWFNLSSKAGISQDIVNNSRVGDMVTSILPVMNVSAGINNTKYICEAKFSVMSSVAIITVIGEKLHTHIHTHTHTHTGGFPIGAMGALAPHTF